MCSQHSLPHRLTTRAVSDGWEVIPNNGFDLQLTCVLVRKAQGRSVSACGAAGLYPQNQLAVWTGFLIHLVHTTLQQHLIQNQGSFDSLTCACATKHKKKIKKYKSQVWAFSSSFFLVLNLIKIYQLKSLLP